MSCRGWLHSIAIAGCLIAGLVIAPLLAQEKPEQKSETPAAQNTQQTAPQSPATIEAVVGGKAVETDWYKMNCPEAQTRDDADLCEQRRMAQAAENSVYLTKLQIWLGAAGALLLGWTLFESRRAATAATKAADSVIGIERAWLLPVVVEENFASVVSSYTEEGMAKALRVSDELNGFTHQPKIEFYFENFGKTPAFVKALSARLEFWTIPPDPSVFLPDMPLPRDSIVGAGVQWPAEEMEIDPFGEHHRTKSRFVRTLQNPFDENSGRGLKAGNARLWFHGEVRYDDVWGNEHKTKFCWAYDGRTGWFIQFGGKPYNENT